ncbi:hypothetical protein BDL97_01G047500 [Sphagnum fallax]|nr:hypothetical protein BDL97_01G047500 [Sphagnum fallax]
MGGAVLFEGAKESPAFRLMTQMGWAEGSGLGKDNQGMKSHIRVKNRTDNSGVGAAEHQAVTRWTVNTHVFDNILKNLKVQAAGSDTKEELNSEAEGEHQDEATEVEAKKVAHPQGRYKRRECGKVVNCYSETGLQSILGCKSDENGAQVAIEVSAEAPKAKIQDKDAEVSVTVSKKKSKMKVDKISTVVTTLLNRENNVSKEDVSPNRVNTEAGSPVVTEWWGSKYGFVRGGKLGSKLHDGDSSINEDAPDRAADKTTLNARTAFCEQDQESLYKLVQDKATAGKRGLGIGDHTRKLGGAHFKGQKTIFGDDGESDGNEAQKDQESTLDQSTDSENLQAGSEDKICRKKQKIGDGIKKGGVKQEGGSKVKLKDLIAHFLSEAPEQGMKLKRLKKQVIATTGLILDPEGDQRDAFKEKLLKSSRFVVEGKKVFLAGAKKRT